MEILGKHTGESEEKVRSILNEKMDSQGDPGILFQHVVGANNN